jgi:hypothetical protein
MKVIGRSLKSIENTPSNRAALHRDVQGWVRAGAAEMTTSARVSRKATAEVSRNCGETTGSKASASPTASGHVHNSRLFQTETGGFLRRIGSPLRKAH